MTSEGQHHGIADAVTQGPRRAADVLRRPPAPDPAIVAEVELERTRWAEITALIELLSPGERLVPGYFANPDWNVKDLVAHLGMWLAEAESQLLNIAAHSYVPHDFDLERRNAESLAALKNEPWEVVWSEATNARAWMLQAWFALRKPSNAANQWVRKAGAEHYGEHIDRLRGWAAELVDLRTRPRLDERDP